MIILLIPLTPTKAHKITEYREYILCFKIFNSSSEVKEAPKKQLNGELHHHTISELAEREAKLIFNTRLSFLSTLNYISIKDWNNPQNLHTIWLTHKIPQLLSTEIYTLEIRYKLSGSKLFSSLLRHLAKFIDKFYVVALILTEMQVDFGDEKSMVTRLRSEVTNIWVVNMDSQDNVVLELMKGLVSRYLQVEGGVHVICALR